MRRLPPLAAVRVFEAAARHGNFTRAADELGMTQAAVSYQVKLLEERLGMPLFVRSGRGIVATDMAQRIAPQVTSAFDLIDEAFKASRSEAESVLTISAPQTLATNWLAPRLGSFQLARPGLAVRVTVSDRIVDLARDGIDLCIRGASGNWPGLESHFLMRMPFVPLASPALLAQHPAIRSVEDLVKLPLISPEDAWWRLWFESIRGAGPEAGGAPAIRFESQVLDGAAAIAGHGVAVLSPPMWQAALDNGQLVAPLDHVAYYRNSFWLLYPEAKRGLAKVRAFRDWVLAEVRASLGEDRFGALVPPDDT